MYQVWKVEQNLVGLLFVVVNSCFDRFDLIRNRFSLFQEWCDILAFLPRGRNALRDLVSSFSETVGLGLFSAPVCVQLYKPFKLADLFGHASLADILSNFLG